MSDEATTAVQEQEPKQYPCSACGAKLEFKPGATALECPYCGHSEGVPQSEEDIEEIDFNAALAELEESAETIDTSTVSCQACAAVVDAPEGKTSFDCPYCGTPIVTQASSGNKIKPKSLLPFHVEKKEAQGKFRDWIHGLWFAPNDLKKRAKMFEHLRGMYVPFWTYDAYTTSFYRGQRGDDYTVQETYTVNGETKTRSKTKTRWRSVSGTVYLSFDDLLVIASRSLPEPIADKLEPWDLENLKPYSDDYLAGFSSESYQVDLKEGFTTARGRMETSIRKEVKRDIGGDRQRISSVNTNYRNVSFKHILLPIWIASYRYNGKPYRFLVNARTGEVQGERPWSWVKITLLVVAIVLVVGGIWLAATSA